MPYGRQGGAGFNPGTMEKIKWRRLSAETKGDHAKKDNANAELPKAFAARCSSPKGEEIEPSHT